MPASRSPSASFKPTKAPSFSPIKGTEAFLAPSTSIMAVEPNFAGVFLGAEEDDLNEYLTPILPRCTGPPEDPDVAAAAGPIRESNGHATLIRQMNGGRDLEFSLLAAEEDFPPDSEEINVLLDDELFDDCQVQTQAPEFMELSSHAGQSTQQQDNGQPVEKSGVDGAPQRQQLQGGRTEGRVDLVSMTAIRNKGGRSLLGVSDPCPICKSGPFGTRFELTSHMRVHAAGNMYCPVAKCPKASGKPFKRQCDYARHAVIHDPPDYCCPFCNDGRKVTFNRSDIFNRHMKSHHFEIPKDDPVFREALGIGDDYANKVRKRAVEALRLAERQLDLSKFIDWDQTSDDVHMDLE